MLSAPMNSVHTTFWTVAQPAHLSDLMVSRGKKSLDDFTVPARVAEGTRRIQKTLKATWSLLLLNYLCWDFKISSGSIAVPSACLQRQRVVRCSFPLLPACGVFSTTLWIQVIQLANSSSWAYQSVALACSAFHSQIGFMCKSSQLLLFMNQLQPLESFCRPLDSKISNIAVDVYKWLKCASLSNRHMTRLLNCNLLT